MKFRVELDGEDLILDLHQNGVYSEYGLRGAVNASGTASIVETMQGVFSILLGHRSFTVHLAQRGDELEIWAENQRYTVLISDARDRMGRRQGLSATGRVELRAQMPGKVVKLLAEPGEAVQAGNGVIVVEAMKMQNEMKAPKDGTVSRILVEEGAAVLAGETLVVIE